MEESGRRRGGEVSVASSDFWVQLISGNNLHCQFVKSISAILLHQLELVLSQTISKFIYIISAHGSWDTASLWHALGLVRTI
jgi:hypothetical protein